MEVDYQRIGPDGHVIVHIGRQRIVILPNRDVDLGAISDDEMIVVGEQRLPTGVVLNPFSMRRDDPRAERVKEGGPSIPLCADGSSCATDRVSTAERYFNKPEISG
jgi:hypothetical protein